MPTNRDERRQGFAILSLEFVLDLYHVDLTARHDQSDQRSIVCASALKKGKDI